MNVTGCGNAKITTTIMQFAKKMVLMPQDVARVVNAVSQDKTSSRLDQLDEAMKNTLERKDLSIYEK